MTSHTHGWHYWVLNLAAEAKPPLEWKEILRELDRIHVDSKYVDKIEAAAFVIRGKRTARWKVPSEEPEFATLPNSLGAAKKLTWLLLSSKGAPGITSDLYERLKCVKTRGCYQLEGHDGNCQTHRSSPDTTVCPLCLGTIEMDDFGRNGRSDPLSIQMGHLTPLSRINQGHNAANVVWAHRRCNYIQDEQTIDETIRNLCELLRTRGYKVSQ